MRRIVVAALVGALMLVSGGARAEAVGKAPLIAHCEAQRAGSVIVVIGVATSPGAISVSLTCRVYVNGQLIGSTSAIEAGPAVVLAGTITGAPAGSVEACASASSRDLDGATSHYSGC